jgi:hypothetical protein
MQNLDDMTLVRDYALNRSEQAFETLVARHIDMVYSAAIRQTGAPHLAEEITQTVFVLLARKAPLLRPGTLLTGWLFKTTRYGGAKPCARPRPPPTNRRFLAAFGEIENE